MSTASDNGILIPSDLAYFEQAEADLSAAIAEIERLMVAEQAIKAEIFGARRDLDGIEALWQAQGLDLDGRPCKNAEERSAALTLRRLRDPGYQRGAGLIAQLDRDLAVNAAQLEAARDRRSLAKRRMEYAIVTLRFLAEAGEARR